MTAPAAPPTPKEARAKTAYVVLKQVEGSSAWQSVATVPAANATAAIQSYAADSSQVDGTYVAIPARSWKPVTVKTETTTHLTIT